MKKDKTKLALQRDVIRMLNPEKLGIVNGGMTAVTNVGHCDRTGSSDNCGLHTGKLGTCN